MRTIAIFLALGLSLSGCELVKKLQNRQVMAGVILETPGVTQPGVDLARTTIAYLFLGERQDNGTDFSQNPPTGLTGADVTLSWETSSVSLAPVATAGQYEATSGIAYVPGDKYTFAAVLGSDTYSGSVTAPSKGEMEEFPPSNPVRTDTFSTFVSQTITRASSASDTLAFYAVLRAVDGSVTCTNGPTQQTPMKLVDIFLNPDPYKADHFDLFKTSTDPEKNCFPEAGTYVVELTTLKQQDEVSGNLFLGSSVFAGTASAGVLVLTP